MQLLNRVFDWIVMGEICSNQALIHLEGSRRETTTTFDLERWFRIEFGAFKGIMSVLRRIRNGFAR
jgi:hypothetical protein